MTTTTTTYVTYDLPGLVAPEQYACTVEDRDPYRAADDAPRGAYAFTFHDIVNTEVDGETLRSQPRNRSGRYFIGGTIRTVDEVAAMPGDHKILVENMRSNGWDWVIFCPPGNVQPFGEGDAVITTIRVIP